MKSCHLRNLVSVCLVGLVMTLCASVASADSYNITVWNGTVGTTATSEIANIGSEPKGAPIASFTYTSAGGLSFDLPSGGTDTVAAFFVTGGGTISNLVGSLNTTMSTADGSTPEYATYMIITGFVGSGFNASVTHDDGASLYVNGIECFDSSAETSAKLSTCTVASSGSYQLVYVASNGLPEVLETNLPGVPEPSSLLLLGSGLLAAGSFIRRKLSR